MAGGIVTSGILFAINTTGGGKAKLAFAAVAAGLVIVGKKLFDAQQAAEKFAQAWDNLDAQQRKAVQAMDAASKGLADTKAAIQAVTSITDGVHHEALRGYVAEVGGRPGRCDPQNTTAIGSHQEGAG